MNAILYRLFAVSVFCSCLFFNAAAVRGQQCPTTSDPNSESVGGFTVPAKVCVGNQVVVNNTPAEIKNLGYAYEYDGVTPAFSASTLSSSTYTYTKPGTYTILQKGSRSGNGATTGTIFCQTVTVINPQKIDFIASACAGLSTTLTLNLTAETALYDQISINWGDGAAPQVINGPFAPGLKSAEHTYAAMQVRTLTVMGRIGGAGGCAGPASPLTLTPAEGAARPVITTLASSQTAITLTAGPLTGGPAEVLRKEPGSSAFTSVGTVGSGGTFSIAAPPDKMTCFQLATRDACGTEQRSSEVCSLVLNARAESKQNILTWIPYNGTYTSFQQYHVFGNGTLISPIPSSGQSAYADANHIQCGERYCYQLRAYVDETEISSPERCVTGVDASMPPAPAPALVSVQGGGVYLKSTLPLPQPSPPPVYTLVVSRADRVGGPFTELGTSNDLTYLDKTANTSAQSYCYQMALVNKCGTKSALTPPACTILLSAGLDGGLRWTAESPFAPGAPGTYLIVRDNPDDKFDVGKVTAYTPDLQSQQTQYRVVAVDARGIESYSNPIDVRLTARLLVPDAFSPNGDGGNDEFMASGRFWDQFEMTLFDRWGAIVYSTTDKDAKGWNGDVNGQVAQPGYYTYRIKISDVTGKRFERTGRFLLIR